MAYYDYNGKDLLSVDEILSMYIWNKKFPTYPTSSKLINEDFIRPLTDKGDALKINLNAYMNHGAGRFISAYNFKFFQDFFDNKNLLARETPYTFKEMWALMKGENSVPITQDKFTVDVFQYTQGIGSSDYMTRAFIFGSTKFTADLDNIQFKVSVDESGNIVKEIVNLKIVPASVLISNPEYQDNFDFQGGGGKLKFLIDVMNDIFEKIDPSQIGRTVPFEYIGDVPFITVTQEEFNLLKVKKALLDSMDAVHVGSVLWNKMPPSYALKLAYQILSSPVLSYKDEQGKFVLYDGHSDNNIDVSSVTWLEKMREIIKWTNGYSLLGGLGDDTLIGGKENDRLYGNEGKDTLRGNAGFDTYFANNNDTISDNDGKGEVLLDNVKLVGGVQDLTGKDKDVYYSEDGSITYRWNKETKELTVNDGLIIQDFDNEELGINLVEAKGQDIAFVVDTTGSMADDIEAVQRQAQKIINMLFDPSKNMAASRIAVVGYNDPSTETLLKFTDHETVAERKQAALNGINQLYARGGGDIPEMLYSGLLRALDGRAGEWREEATAQRIFVFGDAPAKDGHLATQVYRLAETLGIQTRSVESHMLSRSVEKTDVVFQAANKTRKVEIFTILLGNNAEAANDFTDIANATGGVPLNANGASDIADVLYDALQSGTAGDDVQIGNEANNTFNGRAGNDKLFGYGGNDVLNGGVGNDVLDGGEGADKFVFSRYFGQDVVYSDKLDTFVFNDISLNHLKFIQAANHDLLIQQQGTQNQVTVTSFFDGGSSFAALQDNFGNTLSAEQVMEMAQPVAAVDKNQMITGNIFANQLFGGSGDDVIKGLLGNDFLRGNLGNDRLEGGWGADTYVFKAGDGNDTLYDALGNDTLRFEDMGLDRLWFSRDGKNLQIDVLDGGGSVKIENYFTSVKSTHFSTNAIEHFQADGHHLFAIRVNRLLNIMDKFKPTEHTNWNVDMQKQHYLQSNHIEQYWQAIEQY